MVERKNAGRIILIITIFIIGLTSSAQSKDGSNPLILENSLLRLRSVIPKDQINEDKIRSQFKTLNFSRIHRSNFIGSSLRWELRSELQEQLFDIITNFDFEFDITDFESVSDQVADIKFSLSSKKDVFFWNPENSKKFQYMVKDTIRMRPILNVPVSEYFGLGAELGYIISKYSLTDSPYIFEDSGFKNSILKDFKDNKSLSIGSYKSLVRFTHNLASQLGRSLGKIARNMSKRDEGLYVYSKNMLSGIQLPLEAINFKKGDKTSKGFIFPFSAETFQKDIGANLGVGDIFSVTEYVRMNFGASTVTGVSKFSLNRGRYYAISYNFLKTGVDKFRLRISSSIVPTLEGKLPDIRLRLAALSYHPLRYQIGIIGSKQLLKKVSRQDPSKLREVDWQKVKKANFSFQVSRLYDLDLSKKEQRKALDAAFSLELKPLSEWGDFNESRESYEKYQKLLFDLLFLSFKKTRSYGFENIIRYNVGNDGALQDIEIEDRGFGIHKAVSKSRIPGLRNNESKKNQMHVSRKGEKEFYIKNRIYFSDKNFKKRDARTLKKVTEGLLGKDSSAYEEIYQRLVDQENSWKGSDGKELYLEMRLEVPWSDFLEGLNKLNLKDKRVVEDFFGKNSAWFNLSLCPIWRVLRLFAISERASCTLKDIKTASGQGRQVIELLRLYHSFSFSNKARLMGFILAISGGKENPRIQYSVHQIDPKTGRHIVDEANVDRDDKKEPATNAPELLLNINAFGERSVIEEADVFQDIKGDYYLEVTTNRKFDKESGLQVWFFENVFVRKNNLKALVSSDSVWPVKVSGNYVYQFQLNANSQIAALLKELKGKKITLQFRFVSAGVSRDKRDPISEVSELVFEEEKN